jgi:hypothetical protein
MEGDLAGEADENPDLARPVNPEVQRPNSHCCDFDPTMQQLYIGKISHHNKTR